jgi:hypothetical protein
MSASNKAKEIVDKLIKPGMTDLQKEIALHDYVLENTIYDMKTSDQNLVSSDAHTAYGLLLNGQAVCDGYAEAMHLLLTMSGIESDVVYGNEAESEELQQSGWDFNVGHEWNIVKIDGEYYHLDVTWDDNSQDMYKTTSYEYFNKSDKAMSRDHIWDRDTYWECTSEKFHYFNGMGCASREGDTVYYSDQDDGYKLYKMNIDGSGVTRINNDRSLFVEARDGWIYYSNYSDKACLYKIKADGTGRKRLNQDWSININIEGDWITYSNGDDNDRIYKIKTDGSGRQKAQ